MEAVGEHAPNQATRLGLFSNARFHQDPASGLPASSLAGTSLSGTSLPGTSLPGRAVPSAPAAQRGVVLVPEEPAVPATPALDGVSGAVAASLELLGTADDGGR